MGKKLVEVKDAAEYLDISKNTLYTWVSQKRISYVKIGRLVKFDTDTLNSFIQSNNVNENIDRPFRANNN